MNESLKIKKTMLLTAIVAGILLILSCIGLFFGQPGWLLGVALGTGCVFLTLWLTDVGTRRALKDSKIGAYFLSYFLRIIVFVGLFVLIVILQFKLEIDVFKNSHWGMIIGYLPSTFISVIAELKFGEK